MAEYFHDCAEPEALEAQPSMGNDSHWDAAVVVPACGEFDLIQGCLDSLNEAAQAAKMTALAIVVVNARENHPQYIHLENERTLSALESRSNLRLLGIDRTSAGKRFPAKQGVGLARKIGCDLAVWLHRLGRVHSPIIHTTDGDARVGLDYFHPPKESGAAFLHPFVHDLYDPADPLALYEVWLRYYVLGLRQAGSPYAFHTIGSTIAFHAESYIHCRGFPKREAAEDFYLLNKLAKLGAVGANPGTVRLVRRESSRVPFGTGAGSRKLAEQLMRGEPFVLYHPTIFLWLRTWLEALDRFATHRKFSRLKDEVITPTSETLWRALEVMKAESALAALARNHPTPEGLKRNLHGWFDGFRTLKLVHHLRDSCLPSLGYREAIDISEFAQGAASNSPIDILTHLRNLDSPRFVVPAI